MPLAACAYLSVALTAALVASSNALPAAATKGGPPPFNCTTQPEGTFKTYTIKNSKGMEASLIPYGATLTHLLVPDAHGKTRDVVLGWDDATQYCANGQHPYFGATIGRIANRIANGTFELDGKTYHTPLNEKNYDTLHGGFVGFDRRPWTVAAFDGKSVTFSYFSPDGEEGFPGNLWVNVTHSITEDNAWDIKYFAKTDTATVLMMTNHAYFNLNANIDNTATVLKHEVTMPTATTYVEVEPVHLLPTGAIGSVDQAKFLDFRKKKAIGKDIDQGTVTATGGYDNAWIFAGWKPGMPAREVVTMSSPLTGISLTMSTDQPSVQLYSGNFLNATNPSLRVQRKKSQSFGPDKQYYQWRGAATLEAQHYPDSVHFPDFPSVTLHAGKPYVQHTFYRFSAKELK